MGASGQSPAPTPPEPRPLVVGIGASAGGLEALQAFFEKLPADVGAAFVVVERVDPSGRTPLVELLAKRTALPVVALDASRPALAAHVYVAPPGSVVAVERGVLHPRPAASELQRRASSDESSRSLAEGRDESAVGVVFSGAVADATLGLEAVRGDDGRVVRWFGTSTDLEDGKHAEGAVRESEQRLQEVADAMPQIVWTAEPDGTRDYYNRRWYDLTGLPRVPGIERQWHATLHPEDREAVLVAWRKAVEAGSPYEIECRYWVPSESVFRWYLSRALPLRDAEGRVVRWIGTSTDIDDKKRLEKEREMLLEAERAARGEVVRAGRLKDEFLATLSHELRTPLNAILGWAQLLRGGGVAGADLAQGLEVIERNARIQSRLISDLLDVSRIVSGRLRLDLQPVDLADVTAAAVEALAPLAEEKRIALEVALGRPGPRVRGDPGRLEQVVWNLVSNALKFTPGGGSVRVSLAAVDGRAVLSVDDTGKGIAAGFVPHLFERFSQGDPSITRRHGGLGLGLSIVKQLVELHGGSVRARSEGEGRGASFVVELPLSASSGAPREADGGPEPAAEEPRPLGLSGLRVLVVDDEPDARELARRIVEGAGARVETAAGAEEALALLAGFRPEVVVSDVGMPGEDGYRLLARLRARAIGPLPAVALTAFVRTEDRARARQAGFEEHVGKPLEPARLLAAIARVARR